MYLCLKPHDRAPFGYLGGKSRVAPRLCESIPDGREYREPFVGSGAVFWWLVREYCFERYWLNDKNPDVTAFYEALQRRPAWLMGELFKVHSSYEGDALVAQLLSLPPAVRMFIDARIRYGGDLKGGISRIERFTHHSIERLEAFAPHLKGVRITCGDYKSLMTAPGRSVFIFADPPYITDHGDQYLGDFDHARFAAIMSRCKHRSMITYDSSPEHERRLRGFDRLVLDHTYCAAKPERVGEHVFNNYHCEPRTDLRITA